MRILRRKTFNDTLALALLVGIPGLWLTHHWVPLPGEVVGATVSVFTMVVMYYFRKAPPDAGTPTP